ncbi:MAG: metal-dependent transcriptional regulator [Bacteroidia bacterium]|nr:metal-dependent transcriptional regulator [Bacteroidia bacterium]
MKLTFTEENYLKAIYKLLEQSGKPASTNDIAGILQTSAASVTDMVKKLAEKGLVDYEKYKGTRLNEEGKNHATLLIRKHRLWEVFLMHSLKFRWDEVHDIAEQLEHVQSEKLIDELDRFLGFPKYDPHGDPIPDKNGRYTFRHQIPLSQLEKNKKGLVVGVKEHSRSFLNHLDNLNLKISSRIEILDINEYDDLIEIRIDDNQREKISRKVADNLFVQNT